MKLTNIELDCSTGQFSADANINSIQLRKFYSRLEEEFGDIVTQCDSLTPTATATATANTPGEFGDPGTPLSVVAMAVVLTVIVTAVAVAVFLGGLLCFW